MYVMDLNGVIIIRYTLNMNVYSRTNYIFFLASFVFFEIGNFIEFIYFLNYDVFRQSIELRGYIFYNIRWVILFT